MSLSLQRILEFDHWRSGVSMGSVEVGEFMVMGWVGQRVVWCTHSLGWIYGDGLNGSEGGMVHTFFGVHTHAMYYYHAGVCNWIFKRTTLSIYSFEKSPRLKLLLPYSQWRLLITVLKLWWNILNLKAYQSNESVVPWWRSVASL